jgi:hypothetical protein
VAGDEGDGGDGAAVAGEVVARDVAGMFGLGAGAPWSLRRLAAAPLWPCLGAAGTPLLLAVEDRLAADVVATTAAAATSAASTALSAALCAHTVRPLADLGLDGCGLGGSALCDDVGGSVDPKGGGGDGEFSSDEAATTSAGSGRGGRLLAALPRADGSVLLAGAMAAVLPGEAVGGSGGRGGSGESGDLAGVAPGERTDLPSGCGHRRRVACMDTVLLVQMSVMGDVFVTRWPPRDKAALAAASDAAATGPASALAAAATSSAVGATAAAAASSLGGDSAAERVAPARYFEAKSVRQPRSGWDLQLSKRLVVTVPPGLPSALGAAGARGALAPVQVRMISMIKMICTRL